MTYTMIDTIRFIILTFLIIVSFFAAPKTQAYFTTSQSAEALDAHTALFLIDYKFGSPRHTLHLPIYTDSKSKISSSTVSFVILNEENKEVKGKTTSIVISTASLETYQKYTIPKNKSQKFTLAVLFTPDTYSATEKYRLQVTHLPFDFDGTQQLQLNPSELVYYTTKAISL